MKDKIDYGYYDIVERVSNADGASTALALFGATAGKRNYVEDIWVVNTNAASGYVNLRDGTTGAIIATIPLPSGGGGPLPLKKAIRQPTLNTALAYDVSAPLADVIMTFFGYQAA